MRMKLGILVLLLAALLCAAASADSRVDPANSRVDPANAENFNNLLHGMSEAYEQPSAEDGAFFDLALEAIASVSEADGALAEAIVGHWRRVYLDPDYPMYLYDGGQVADALADAGIPDAPTHAFVVLGFELKDGEMTDELIGRCNAAAAAARAFPQAILVCSGGATGDNNPEGHTEAGMMKAYLAEACGIDAARIFIDERAMTTLENAVNTFAILREQGVRTLTLVTSSYHQRWGQVLYNAMSALCRRDWGYGADIVANYSYPVEAPSAFAQDDRIALRQLAAMLGLP